MMRSEGVECEKRRRAERTREDRKEEEENKA